MIVPTVSSLRWQKASWSNRKNCESWAQTDESSLLILGRELTSLAILSAYRESQEKERRINDLRSQLVDSEADNDEMRQKFKHKLEQVEEEWRDELNKMKLRSESAEKEKEEMIVRLKRRMDDSEGEWRQEIQRLKEKLELSEDQKDEMRKQYRQKMDEIELEWKREIQELREAHKDYVKRLTDEHEEEFSRIRKSLLPLISYPIYPPPPLTIYTAETQSLGFNNTSYYPGGPNDDSLLIWQISSQKEAALLAEETAFIRGLHVSPAESSFRPTT